MWSWGLLLSKFDNLYHILREINCWCIQTVQKCYFWLFLRLLTLNFVTFGTWKLLKFTGIKIETLYYCQKLHFGEFKQSNNVNFDNFRGCEFWFESIWASFKSQNYHDSKFRVSKIAENDIFELFEYTKIWFHIKSEWQ